MFPIDYSLLVEMTGFWDQDMVQLWFTSLWYFP